MDKSISVNAKDMTIEELVEKLVMIMCGLIDSH